MEKIIEQRWIVEQENISFSAMLENHIGTFKNQSDSFVDIFIITSENIIVDCDYNAENYNVNNLFICANGIFCDGEQPRKITLNGRNGKNNYLAAPRGAKYGDKGTDGERGVPGENGGNIFVLTNKIIGDLEFISKGGDGGIGQDGGPGRPGYVAYPYNQLQHLLSQFKELDARLEAIYKILGFGSINLTRLNMKDFDQYNNPTEKAKTEFLHRMELIDVLSFIFAALRNEEIRRFEIEKFRTALNRNATDNEFICTPECVVCPKYEDPYKCVKQAERLSKNLECLLTCKNFTWRENINKTSPIDGLEGILKGFEEMPSFATISKKIALAHEIKIILQYLLGDKHGKDAWKKYVSIVQNITSVFDAKYCHYHGLNFRLENEPFEYMMFATKSACMDIRQILEILQLGECANSVEDAPEHLSFTKKVKFWNTVRLGGTGGQGGEPGIGGQGGCPGNITVYVGNMKTTDYITVLHGEDGAPGRHGKMGRPGETMDGVRSRMKLCMEKLSEGEEFCFCDTAVGWGENQFREWELSATNLDNSNKANFDCKKCCNLIEKEEVLWPVKILRNKMHQEHMSGNNTLALALEQHEWAMRNVLTVEVYVSEYVGVIQQVSLLSAFDSCISRRATAEETFRGRLAKAKIYFVLNSQNVIDMLFNISLETTTSIKHRTNFHQTILNLEFYFTAIQKILENLQLSETHAAVSIKRLVFKKALNKNIDQTKEDIRNHLLNVVEKMRQVFDDMISIASLDLKSRIKFLKKKDKLEKLGASIGAADKLLEISSSAIEIPGSKVIAGVGRVLCLAASSTLENFKPSAAMPKILQQRFIYDDKTLIDVVGVFIENTIKALSNNSCIDEPIIEKYRGLQAQLKNMISKTSKIDSKKLVESLNALNELQELVLSELELKIQTCKDKREHDLLESTFRAIATESKYFYFSMPHKVTSEEDLLNIVMKRFSSLLNLFYKKLTSDAFDDISLDVSECKMKEFLSNIIDFVDFFVKDLPPESDIYSALKCIKLSLDAYSGALKTVRKYEEEIQSIYANTASGTSAHEFGELEESIGDELVIIKFNQIAGTFLMDYGKMVKAFYQYTFPFADKYISPKQSEIKYFKSVCKEIYRNHNQMEFFEATSKCKEIVQYLVDVHKTSLSQTNQEDSFVFYNYFTGSTGSLPFYTWDQNDNSELIKSLLSGISTDFVAKVENSPKGKAAIKMNGTIDLRFVVKEDSEIKQEELDEFMSLFILEMTHSGNSDYRVGSEFHRIQNEKITLSGNVGTSLEITKADSDIVMQNDIRSKMIDYIYSPYTKWTLKLRLRNPIESEDGKESHRKQVEKFSKHVQVLLVGWGKYLDENATGFCNPEVKIKLDASGLIFPE